MPAANTSDESAAEDQPLKQWQIRAAIRSFQRRGGAQRNPAELIVVAAWELVNEHEDFTLRQVTERAGVSLQTFYKNFASKDELILAMLEESIERGTADMETDAAERDDPVERLRILVTKPILTVRDEGAIRDLRWRARERQRISQRYPEAVEAVDDGYRAAIADAIEAARDAGLVTSVDPAFDASLLQHLAWVMTHLQWGGGLRQSPEVTVDALWRLCWDGLRVRPGDEA